MEGRRSTPTVILAFFTVMASFLAFILLIPDKGLLDWQAFLFILLAEFSYFIACLFLPMLPARTSHPIMKRLLLAYLFLVGVISGVFIATDSSATNLFTIIQVALLVVTILGLVVLALKGRPVPENVS